MKIKNVKVGMKVEVKRDLYYPLYPEIAAKKGDILRIYWVGDGAMKGLQKSGDLVVLFPSEVRKAPKS